MLVIALTAVMGTGFDAPLVDFGRRDFGNGLVCGIDQWLGLAWVRRVRRQWILLKGATPHGLVYPIFASPTFTMSAISVIAPVALILVAENLGHLRAVQGMTGHDMNPYMGRAFMADGLATMVSAVLAVQV